MEHLHVCLLCGSRRRLLFEQIRDTGGSLQYYLCSECGLVYQSPRMDPQELRQFYLDKYRKHGQEQGGPSPSDLQMESARAWRALQMVRPTVHRIARHLDFGSSAGEVLLQFHKPYRCQSVGVELGEAYRRFSQHRGLAIYDSLEEMRNAAEERFDFVSITHVLEHVPDPVELVRELRTRWMTPEGALLVEVPNLIEHEALELAHLFAFTAATLTETIRKAGFRVVWKRAHGSFRSPILKLYLTLLAQADPGAGVPWRKRSGPFGIKQARHVGKIKRQLFTKYLPNWTWQSPETALPPALDSAP